MKAYIALAVVMSVVTPASARTFDQRLHDLPAEEWAFQALNVADKVITADCLRRDICSERNPLLGRNPSNGRLALAGLGEGVLHAAATSYLQDHASARTVRLWEHVSVAVGAGVVAWNLHVRFR
jgi:hypothetical protein